MKLNRKPKAEVVEMENILVILNELHPEFNYRDSNDFLTDGYLDSFDLVALVSMLEEKYNIKIDALDILPENFSSAAVICELVRKSGGAI